MNKATEVIATNNLQGVPAKGKQHQWELTNHPEIVHMCVVCGQQTKVIWRANGECLGYLDLFQDFKGAPPMTVEHPEETVKKNEAAPKEKPKKKKMSGLAKLKRPVIEEEKDATGDKATEGIAGDRLQEGAKAGDSK